MVGMRSKASDTDFGGLLSEELESELREAALLSMGTEVESTHMCLYAESHYHR